MCKAGMSNRCKHKECVGRALPSFIKGGRGWIKSLGKLKFK